MERGATVVKDIKQTLRESVNELLESPTMGMRRICREERIEAALILWTLCMGMSFLLPMVQKNNVSGIFLFLSLGGTLLGRSIMVAMIHFISDLWGGRGRIKGAWAGLLFADIPLTIVGILHICIAALPPFIGNPLGTCISFCLGMMSLYLAVVAIRENYRLTTIKSVCIMLLPILAIIGLGILALAVLSFNVATTLLTL